MTKISIIIPVYNAQDYLKETLDSVCNQSLKDIEIICVNDCSTDESLSILKKYADSDNRIKLIDFKENRGVSAARNAGIDSADGEYIGFVDADDHMALDFCDKLYSKSLETNADIIKGGDVRVEYSDGHVDTWQQNDSIRENKLNFYAQIYSAIYKSNLINDNKIRFPEQISIGEDISFITKAAIVAKSISIVDDAIYYYMRREDSLDSEKYNLKKSKDFIEHIKIVEGYFEEFDLTLEDKKLFFARFISQLDKVRKYKVESNSEEYKLLTMAFNQRVIQKMRLK
jgi:glycosyltransferase involved in cell wall biosynthesis